MKKIITLTLILVAFVIEGFANHTRNSSKLKLNFSQNATYTVNVNGLRYFDVHRSLFIPNLSPGTHKVRVVAHFWNNNRGNARRRVVFVDYINVPFNSTVTAMVNPHRGVKVVRVVNNNRPKHQNNQNRHHHRPNNHRKHRGDGYNGNNHKKNRPSGNNFYAVKSRMQHAGFDSDRLAIAKRFIRQNNIKSHQVAEMMKLLSFEDTRLKLAKFAYEFTVDYQNYELVFDSLRFSSSKRKLDTYIARF